MKADVIYNTTTTKYGLVDLLKLMIGGKSVTNVEIETSNEVVNVLKTTAHTHVQYPDWINRIRNRNKKGFEYPIMSAGQKENNTIPQNEPTQNAL